MQPPIHSIRGEYIREWLVLGPFPDDSAFGPLESVGGTENTRPQEGDTVTVPDGKRLTWTRFRSSGRIIELPEAVGYHPHTAACAYCVLESETDGNAEIQFQSNCPRMRVWVNGRLVGDKTDWHHRPLEYDPLEVNVRVGANDCLIEAVQEAWRASFQIRVLPSDRAVIRGRITDTAEAPVADAFVRLEPSSPQQEPVERPPIFGVKETKAVARGWTDTAGVYQMSVYPVGACYDFAVSAARTSTAGILPKASDEPKPAANPKTSLKTISLSPSTATAG